MDRSQQFSINSLPWRAQARGMTLMEASMAMVFISAIMLVAFQILLAQGKVATEQIVETDMQGTLRRGADELTNELADAHLLALDSFARWVEYQKPMANSAGMPVLDQNGNVQFGAIDSTGTFRLNGFFHLEFVDDPARPVITADEKAWGQDIDMDGNLSRTFTFTPGSFQLSIWRNANETTTITYSAFSPYPPLNSMSIATVNCTIDRARTLAVECYRDSTKRDGTAPNNFLALAAPYNTTGEGIFYMRQTRANGPLQHANTLNGTTVTPDYYGNNRYFEPDAGTFTDSNNNNVLDQQETPPPGTSWNHNLRLSLIAVYSGNGDGLASGNNKTVQGIKRVVSTETLIKLRN